MIDDPETRKLDFTPVRYVNELGEVRYQPTLPNGGRKWRVSDGYFYDSSYRYQWEGEPRPSNRGRYTPILFRSRSRAARVAKREYKRNQRALAQHRLSKKKKFREDNPNESQAVS